MMVALAVLTTLAAGLPVALAIDRRAHGPALVGLSFLYGTALVYAVTTLLSAIGIPWSLVSVQGAVLLFSALALYVATHSGERLAGQRLPPARLHGFDVATLLAITGYWLLATIAPVWEWDFWAIFGLKGRVFLSASKIDWSYLENRLNDFAHPDYPLLLPLNYSYAGLFPGGWSDRWLGIYTVAFGVALLLVIRQLTAAELASPYAALITFAATAFALSESVGLAEAPVIAFGTAGVLYLRRGALFDDRIALRQGAILLGCAALSKNEGLSLLVAAAAGLAIVNWRLVPKLWPAVVIYAPWTLAKVLHTLPSYLTRGSAAGRAMERLHHPAAFLAPFIANFADVKLWLLMLCAVLVIAPSRLWRERFVIVTLIVQAGFFLAAYLVTPYDVAWQVSTSWPRLTRQLGAPLLCVVLMMLAATAAPDDDQRHAEARPDL